VLTCEAIAAMRRSALSAVIQEAMTQTLSSSSSGISKSHLVAHGRSDHPQANLEPSNILAAWREAIDQQDDAFGARSSAVCP
jgi:hypothetical protein